MGSIDRDYLAGDRPGRIIIAIFIPLKSSRQHAAARSDLDR